MSEELEKIKIWLDIEYKGMIDARLQNNQLIITNSNKIKSIEEQLNEIMEDEVLRENLDILGKHLKK